MNEIFGNCPKEELAVLFLVLSDGPPLCHFFSQIFLLRKDISYEVQGNVQVMKQRHILAKINFCKWVGSLLHYSKISFSQSFKHVNFNKTGLTHFLEQLVHSKLSHLQNFAGINGLQCFIGMVYRADEVSKSCKEGGFGFIIFNIQLLTYEIHVNWFAFVLVQTSNEAMYLLPVSNRKPSKDNEVIACHPEESSGQRIMSAGGCKLLVFHEGEHGKSSNYYDICSIACEYKQKISIFIYINQLYNR